MAAQVTVPRAAVFLRRGQAHALLTRQVCGAAIIFVGAASPAAIVILKQAAAMWSAVRRVRDRAIAAWYRQMRGLREVRYSGQGRGRGRNSREGCRGRRVKEESAITGYRGG